jgi:Ca2+-dependent lipid-binding protein
MDLQADVQSNMTINVVDFAKTTQKDLIAAAMAADNVDVFDVEDLDEDYDYNEFTPPEATANVIQNDGTI